jgi:hypothetical protein
MLQLKPVLVMLPLSNCVRVSAAYFILESHEHSHWKKSHGFKFSDRSLTGVCVCVCVCKKEKKPTLYIDYILAFPTD